VAAWGIATLVKKSGRLPKVALSCTPAERRILDELKMNNEHEPKMNSFSPKLYKTTPTKSKAT
jgi:hypothetical protein